MWFTAPGRPRGVTTLYVIGIGRLAPLATTKAEPLGLEMDANPVTKGARHRAEREAAESEQNIRNTEVGRYTVW